MKEQTLERGSKHFIDWCQQHALVPAVQTCTLGTGAKYCDKYVCLFVCLSLCSRVSKPITPNFNKFSVHVDCSRGQVPHPLIQSNPMVELARYNTLCISGFEDNVMFSQNGLYGALCVLLSGHSITA